MNKSQIVKDTIRRFQHLPNRTVAQFLVNEYGELFDNNLEKARDAVRYYAGKKGEANRDGAADKSLFQTDRNVKMPQTWRKVRTPYNLPVGLWLVLSDIHIPFHEPKPLEAAIQWGQANKVNGIFLNGDILDCAAVSYWPTAKRDFNKEIEAGIDFFDFLRNEFPKSRIVYKPGNHEYRLPRLFVSKVPELCETPYAAMETVMGFEQRGVEFLDYHQIVKAGKLPILHGHELPNIQRTVSPARGLFLRTKNFAACSHCHTTSEFTTRDINGNIITTWSFGALCDLTPDYNPLGNDWNWGAALINIEKDEDFDIENKRILPNGKLR